MNILTSKISDAFSRLTELFKREVARLNEVVDAKLDKIESSSTQIVKKAEIEVDDLEVVTSETEFIEVTREGYLPVYLPAGLVKHGDISESKNFGNSFKIKLGSNFRSKTIFRNVYTYIVKNEKSQQLTYYDVLKSHQLHTKPPAPKRFTPLSDVGVEDRIDISSKYDIKYFEYENNGTPKTVAVAVYSLLYEANAQLLSGLVEHGLNVEFRYNQSRNITDVYLRLSDELVERLGGEEVILLSILLPKHESDSYHNLFNYEVSVYVSEDDGNLTKYISSPEFNLSFTPANEVYVTSYSGNIRNTVVINPDSLRYRITPPFV